MENATTYENKKGKRCKEKVWRMQRLKKCEGFYCSKFSIGSSDPLKRKNEDKFTFMVTQGESVVQLIDAYESF